MRVLHISDIHYRKSYTTKNPYEDMLSSMDSSFTRLQNVVTSVLERFAIEAIVITGDLCDDGGAEDYAFLKSYFDTLGVPVYVCLGNHDRKDNFYRGWYGHVCDKPYLRVHENQMTWICFDNSEYGYPNGYLDQRRLSWLAQQLKCHKNCIVLMHHQFEDLQGIPGLEQRDALCKVLFENPPVAIFNGHTHWIRSGKVGQIPYFTAPSMSFRAVNEVDGSVVFSQSHGYCIYDAKKNGVHLIVEEEVQEKQLAVWR